MEAGSDSSGRQGLKSEESVSRTHSQDRLDTSSASSLSFFADVPSGHPQSNDSPVDHQKSGECSPKASMNEALKSEKAFIEYVMSFPAKEISDHHRSADSVSSKSKSPAAGSGSTSKVGLDHLDNLCKLMEQLSELRENNNKLHKRVQYLEDLKALHDMHKEITEEGQYSSEDALVSKPRPYELKKSATESCCPKKEEALVAARSPSRYLSRRSRSQSGQRRERSKSVGHEDAVEDSKSRRLFPKWSKVKEAFGWESERKESTKMKEGYDPRSPGIFRRCSDESYHSGGSTWYHNYPSLHSSVEDVSGMLETERWKRPSLASEKNVMRLQASSEGLKRQKSTPSPNSDRVTAYQELKPKSYTIERDSYPRQDFSKFEKEDSKRGKSPWGRVKTIIERRRDSLKRRSVRRDHSCSDCSDTAMTKKTSEATEPLDFKSYAEFTESSGKHEMLGNFKQKSCKAGPIILDQESDCVPRTPSSSPTFHRKSRWTRVKKALKGKREDEKDSLSLSTPASPNGAQDGNFPFDAIEENSQDSYEEGRDIPRVGSDSHLHQMGITAPQTDLMLQLQRNLSEDFHRKIQEWERIRASGHHSQWDRKTSETSRSRKKSERYDKNPKPKFKDLTWLEKELQKIEKEKQRLSKEKQKYEERALRLEKLKETVLNAKNSNKREVLVRTSAGEFRFEGISDAFTKKLYEWETKRGVGPELSTIALLDSSRLTVQASAGPKGGLQRVVSRSESSVADIGQPSHNSSNSLPSLKLPESAEADKQNHPSRANSEPDLSTLVALTNGSNVSVSCLVRKRDSLDDEIADPEPGSKESLDEEPDKRRKDSETYYGLLEENVILLEQLRDKEEICSRLETELEVLDNKVDVMNAHHVQETERYREKLWEMHKPGATPRDVQCCLRTMAQLRKRIETLEKCTEKLRNDRESVEDSFRYHTKQQEHMTLDLLEKMRELQAVGSSAGESDEMRANLNASAVERLQELTAQLVKQTQELEETLSAKTRQISQLKWELLHRDLSTVKLETELHTHTAHRKRSKYAHYRSHSSEEASALPFPQELDFEKSTLVTDIYYNAVPASEFKATQLTNTVQQLNKEVLKLASASDGPAGGVLESENLRLKKSTPQNKLKDHTRQITVRRSSADSISYVSTSNDGPKQDSSTSTDSEGTSEEGYTRVTWKSNGKGSCPVNADGERLLMSYGEHPPRNYPQRRKKLQKVSRCNSSPGRKRSNTFHNNRDLEKQLDRAPQKCQSFRVMREKHLEDTDARNNVSDSTLNIRNLLQNYRYPEMIKKGLIKYKEEAARKSPIPSKNDAQKLEMLVKDNNRLLREVASDSKIPFLIQLQHRVSDVAGEGRQISKHPVRSMSDKHRKETAAERREHFQKKRCKKRVTSPDLFAHLRDPLDVRSKVFTASNKTSKRAPNSEHDKDRRDGVCQKSQLAPPSETATITIQLPKRKSTKSSPLVEHLAEETVTIIMPKKRSFSSEKESSISENSAREVSNEKGREESDVSTDIDFHDKTPLKSCTDPHLYRQPFLRSGLLQRDCTKHLQPLLLKDPCDRIPNQEKADSLKDPEQISRKRKAEDGDSLSRTTAELIQALTTSKETSILPSQFETGNSTMVDVKKEETAGHGYVKSPSAPHLDWRKTCAKKISREGAPNVRTLIERYNKVVESQAPKSPVSSNISSPVGGRKGSSYSCSGCSESCAPPPFISTPNTPTILSTSSFYSPLIFKPTNLDLFPKTPPASPMSSTRSEALRKAKEKFISSENSLAEISEKDQSYLNEHSNDGNTALAEKEDVKGETAAVQQQKVEDDRISNSSMDSMSLVVFRTGETCKESRLSKRSIDCSKSEAHTMERHPLKPSKSLSNSSIFKTVLSSDFKMPTNFLKLRKSKRKKDMSTVSQLCRQSLLLGEVTGEDIPTPATHKSCPSSPELKSKSAMKPNWFHRNILRHK